MENSKDGGPAFPYGEDDWDGMSLRDYFAAKSLAGNLDYFLNLKLKRGIVAKEIADLLISLLTL
jgi:hypothetical protein